MKFMRIVSMSSSGLNIQTSNQLNRDYVQEFMTHDEFGNFMAFNFPVHWKEYLINGNEQSAAEFFYHFGETPEMRRKGEAYIYIKDGE